LLLPQVRLEEVRMQTALINLLRRPDVLVEVSGVAGLADVKSIADEAGRDDQGRPVRSFYVDSLATSPVLVTIKPNHPRVYAEQVTRITCVENTWCATCDFNLQVSEGVLDTIDLEVPASWKDGVKTNSAMATVFTAISDERWRLALWPSVGISRSESIALTGPPSATPIAVPNITIKHVQSVKKYVLLPQLADRRPIAWARQNLRRCDSKETAPDDPVKYEVIAEPWQAVLLPSQKLTAAARVVQADVRYALQTGGGCLGAAFLDVEPAGATDCRPELPEGFDLLQVAVDGLPVDAVRGTAGTWSVPWASQAAVAHVELLYFAESASALVPSGRTRCWFRAPKLGDLPVDRIAWTVVTPRTLQATIVDGDQDQTPPVSSLQTKASDITAQWQRFMEKDQTTVSFTTSGTVDAIAMDYRSAQTPSWFPRLLGAAGLLAAAGLTALLIRRDLLRKWFTRRPYVFGVGIGVAWWLWLSPSVVGLVIVLVVVLRRFLRWRMFPRPAAARG
jgi:hypothetical protein